VVSELEQLKIWGRISKYEYKDAFKRWKRANATIIDFKNQFLSSAFGKECMISMEKHHGVKQNNIVNDCQILVSVLKNGVDLFLSEDYHFTSKITTKVVNEIKNAACKEYNLLCDSEMYSVDSRTFLKSYSNRNIDLDIVKSSLKNIRKDGKLFELK
jgi:hypothetical protein